MPNIDIEQKIKKIVIELVKKFNTQKIQDATSIPNKLSKKDTKDLKKFKSQEATILSSIGSDKELAKGRTQTLKDIQSKIKVLEDKNQKLVELTKESVDYIVNTITKNKQEKEIKSKVKSSVNTSEKNNANFTSGNLIPHQLGSDDFRDGKAKISKRLGSDDFRDGKAKISKRLGSDDFSASRDLVRSEATQEIVKGSLQTFKAGLIKNLDKTDPNYSRNVASISRVSARDIRRDPKKLKEFTAEIKRNIKRGSEAIEHKINVAKTAEKVINNNVSSIKTKIAEIKKPNDTDFHVSGNKIKPEESKKKSNTSTESARLQNLKEYKRLQTELVKAKKADKKDNNIKNTKTKKVEEEIKKSKLNSNLQNKLINNQIFPEEIDKKIKAEEDRVSKKKVEVPKDAEAPKDDKGEQSAKQKSNTSTDTESESYDKKQMFTGKLKEGDTKESKLAILKEIKGLSEAFQNATTEKEKTKASNAINNSDIVPNIKKGIFKSNNSNSTFNTQLFLAIKEEKQTNKKNQKVSKDNTSKASAKEIKSNTSTESERLQNLKEYKRLQTELIEAKKADGKDNNNNNNNIKNTKTKKVEEEIKKSKLNSKLKDKLINNKISPEEIDKKIKVEQAKASKKKAEVSKEKAKSSGGFKGPNNFIEKYLTPKEKAEVAKLQKDLKSAENIQKEIKSKADKDIKTFENTKKKLDNFNNEINVSSVSRMLRRLERVQQVNNRTSADSFDKQSVLAFESTLDARGTSNTDPKMTVENRLASLELFKEQFEKLVQ